MKVNKDADITVVTYGSKFKSKIKWYVTQHKIPCSFWYFPRQPKDRIYNIIITPYWLKKYLMEQL